MSKALLCLCGHLRGQHQITNLGYVSHCVECGCKSFSAPTQEPTGASPQAETVDGHIRQCDAIHLETGAVCELPLDHTENHRGAFRGGVAQWPYPAPVSLVEPEPCVWRDIATVPKDGTRILLTPAVWTAERVVSAYYRLGMWWVESADARGSIRAFTDPDEDASHWPFTHWTPLPGAPLKVER